MAGSTLDENFSGMVRAGDLATKVGFARTAKRAWLRLAPIAHRQKVFLVTSL